MSFDLGIWHRKRPFTKDEAGGIYKALCSGDASVVDTSPSIAAFFSDLTARYPDINDYPLEKIDDCPWNCSFDRSDGHVILNIAWSRVEEVLPFVSELVAKHKLVAYDPQENELYAGPAT